MVIFRVIIMPTTDGLAGNILTGTAVVTLHGATRKVIVEGARHGLILTDSKVNPSIATSVTASLKTMKTCQ